MTADSSRNDRIDRRILGRCQTNGAGSRLGAFLPKTQDRANLLAVAALAAWIAGFAAILLLDDPRLRFLRFLGGYGLAAAAWLVIVLLAERGSIGRRARVAAIAVALSARALCLFFPPAFSEDAYRHIYEGRAARVLGPGFPFQHAPASAPELGVSPDLLDSAWLRINHPHIATIYPPFAQLVFVSAGALGDAAGGGRLVWLKLLLVLADLATWTAIATVVRLRGRPTGSSLVYALSPLVILETEREGHADVLGALGLAIALFGVYSGRARTGFFGFALAALGKLHGLIGFVAMLRTTRRGAEIALLGVGLLLIPLVFAGPAALSGLGAYTSAWRAGDGMFGLVLEGAETILGGDWTRIDALDLTITRHQLARGITAVLFAGFAIALLRREGRLEDVPERTGLLFLALFLLSPVLLPWYPICLVPFIACVDRGRAAMLALVTLAPLLHHPAWLELAGGEWRELDWVKALVHGPAWLFLLWGELGNRVRARELGRADPGGRADRV